VRHNISKLFGKRVREIRKRRKLSQERLAEKAGLDRSFMSGIERGVENPTLYTIQAVAEGLGVTVGELMKGL
jgi:transcriptional regulator with XRE-family HTH domain